MIAASVILQLFSYSVLLPTKSLTKINIDFVYKMCSFFRVSDIGLGHLKGSITKFSGNTRNNGRESECITYRRSLQIPFGGSRWWSHQGLFDFSSKKAKS